MKQLIITDSAISDIVKAKKWYSSQQLNLGITFADYVFKCCDDILKQPLAFPSKFKNTREYFIKKYPY